MFAVIYVGIDRVTDIVGIPADVQCDPLFKHVEGISAVYCCFMQTVQGIEIGCTDPHEQKTRYSVDSKGSSYENRFIAASSGRSIRVVKCETVECQSCGDQSCEDQDQYADHSADLVQGLPDNICFGDQQDGIAVQGRDFTD